MKIYKNEDWTCYILEFITEDGYTHTITGFKSYGDVLAWHRRYHAKRDDLK